jgi:SAM-dependent methyltransferase
MQSKREASNESIGGGMDEARTRIDERSSGSSNNPPAKRRRPFFKKHEPDSFELIARAVQYDEKRQDESFLLQPLESASLYDLSKFWLALDLIGGWAKPAAKSAAAHKLRKTALAPVVVSGLIVSTQRSTTCTRFVSVETRTSELVAFCQRMRRLALARVRRRKRRYELWHFVVPIVVVAYLAGMAFQQFRNRHVSLVDLQYVGSCEQFRSVNGNGSYESACRLAETRLWESYQDYLVVTNATTSFDHVHDLSLWWSRKLPKSEKDSGGRAPLALHTSLLRPLVRMDDLVDHQSVVYSRSLPGDVSCPSSKESQYPLRWLGETTVTRLVRSSLTKYANHTSTTSTKGLSLLDVGCGVGGLLYSILPGIGSSTNRKLMYHGISISDAEIYHAQRFAERHNVSDTVGVSFEFERQSFESSLPLLAYNAVVAIESLRYSHNVQATVEKLMTSLQPGGVLIVVDDVASNDGASLTFNESVPSRPSSLLSHKTWMGLFANNSCTVQKARDLSLEYELAGLTVSGLKRVDTQNWIYELRERLGLFKCHYFSRMSAAFPRRGISGAVGRRMRALCDDQAALARQRNVRREEYQKVNLQYRIYVCTKAI